MTHFYSPSAKGFFLDTIHKKIPDDAIALTEEHYNNLINCESTQEISVVNGFPILVDRDLTITWEMIRKQRASLMAKTDWTQLGDVPTETAAKYKAYRQALRDVPQRFNSPDAVIWPTLEQYGINV